MPPSQDPLLNQNLTSPYHNRAASALINLHIHLLQRNDGSGGLTGSQVSGLLDQLAEDFAPVGVFFASIDQSAILNTTWFDDPAAHADTLMALNGGADRLDVILGPASGTVAGKAAGIPGTALVLTGDTANTRALSHLVGHCLGLYDTDETVFGSELPDGTNKATAGDLVSDTAADPGLNGYVTTTCELNAQFGLDHPDHAPDPSNIMSAGRMSCWSAFSAEQGARMLAVLEHVPAMQAVRSQPAVTYTDRSSLTGLQYSGQPLAAAPVDYDNDGKKDLLISFELTGTAMAWRGSGYDIITGTPSFQDQTSSAFPTTPPSAGTLGFVLGDFDNDGWVDFYAANTADLGDIWNSRLYHNNGGVFTDVTSLLGSTSHISVIAASWADYDGDGDLDLLVIDGWDPYFPWDSYVHLYRNDVSIGGGFVLTTEESGILSTMPYPMPYLSPLWADFDGDGHLDLLLLDSGNTVTGPVTDARFSRYLANNGDGTFTNVTSSMLDTGTIGFGFGTLAAVADVDNDGDLDVVFIADTYNNLGPVGYLINDGGTLTVSQPQLFNYSHVNDLAILDYDLDGHLDVLLSVANGEADAAARTLLLANRQGVLVDESSLVGLGQTGRTMGLGLADYNLDGFADLYVTRPATGHFFYKAAASTTPQRQWTGVRLVSAGKANNRLGLGATVTVTAGSHTQMQIVDGGSGKARQHELDLVFGLGDYTGSLTATVRWPTGRTQTVTLQPNQYNVITDDSPVVDDTSVTAYLVHHLDTGTQDWVFEWTTSHDVDDSKDQVTIKTASLPSQCIPAETVLTPSLAGVEHQVVLLTNGTYRHRLTWGNVPCVARCNIPYEVQSGIDQFTSKSKTNRKLNITTCLQSL